MPKFNDYLRVKELFHSKWLTAEVQGSLRHFLEVGKNDWNTLRNAKYYLEASDRAFERFVDEPEPGRLVDMNEFGEFDETIGNEADLG